ncbi:MAG: hypothetical protein JJU20_15275 [Opitutales bacterium]|nr:hypothetical protein [Opitutales bacterium]
MPESPENETNPLIEQALRLGELRKEVMHRIDGPTFEGGTEGIPMETQVSFWEHVLAFESAEESTLAERLKHEACFVPVEPDELKDETAISTALWDLIRALASIRVFVFDTDHLCDADLYRLLVYGALPEPRMVPPAGSQWNCRIDACEHGTSDDPDGTMTWLRYYASEDVRSTWEDEVPPRENPPYDRDRFLPVPPEERQP